MNGQLRAVLDSAEDLVDVAEVDHRIDALAEEIHPERGEADVSGTFAVTEEATLDAVRIRQQRELGGRDRCDSTEIVTSSGIRSRLMSRRTK